MKIVKQYLIKNDVYTNNLGRIDNRYKKFQDEGPKGLMLHSVGAAQPKAEVFIKSWNKPGVEKATHGFIEPNAVYQTLPWNYRGWHAGGTANNTHIGVEMTEPSTIKYTGGSSWVDLDPKATEAHIRKTYANAVELFAKLCKEFKLDPLADGVIISHSEGHKRGIASNHGDPEHIWNKFGLSMDLFRAAVAEAMRPAPAAPATQYRVQAGVFSSLDNAEALRAKLIASGFEAIIVTGNVTTVASAPKHKNGTVKVNSTLNVRSGPGTGYDRTDKLKNGTKVVIVEEKNGWGKLSTGGWVSMDYITF